MTKNIYRHTERSEVSFFGIFSLTRPWNKFRVTGSCLSCWTRFSIFQLTNLAYHSFFFFRTHYSFFSSWYFRNKRVFTARLTALTVTHSAQVSLSDETLPQQKHPVNVFARGERITCTPTRKKRRRLLRRVNSHPLAIATQIDSSVFRPQNDEKYLPF